MRTARNLKRKMYYALQGEEHPVYETDEDGNIKYYEDSEGNRYPILSDDTEIGYYSPVEFKGNIAFSGGEIDETEFGLSVSDYDASLVVEKNAFPIAETSLIWFESEPRYKDNDKTIVDDKSADFRVVAKKPSLNFDKYLLKKRNK